MHTVELERVTKTFGRHIAVNDVSLAVPEGAVYGFIGPNGSGKTTTVRMILNINDENANDIPYRLFCSSLARRRLLAAD